MDITQLQFLSIVVQCPMSSNVIIVQYYNCPMSSNIMIVQFAGAFLEAAVGGWKETGGEGAGSKVHHHQSIIKRIKIIIIVIIIKIIIIIINQQNYHHHHHHITGQAGENGAKPLLSPG